jgi:hypothetical protein
MSDYDNNPYFMVEGDFYFDGGTIHGGSIVDTIKLYGDWVNTGGELDGVSVHFYSGVDQNVYSGGTEAGKGFKDLSIPVLLLLFC